MRTLHNADVKERLFNNGIDVIGNTPQESAAAIKVDAELNRRLLKRIGMLRE